MLLRQTGETRERIKKVRFNPTEKRKKVRVGSFLSRDTRTFQIQLSEIAYSRDNVHHLFADIDTGKLLSFNEHATFDPQSADTHNAQGLIKAAVKAAGENIGLIGLVLALLAGLAGGFILGQNLEGIIGAFQ